MRSRVVFAAATLAACLAFGAQAAQDAGAQKPADDAQPATQSDIIRLFVRDAPLATSEEIAFLGDLWKEAPWESNALGCYARAFEIRDRVARQYTDSKLKVPGTAWFGLPYAGDPKPLEQWAADNRPALEWMLRGLKLPLCQVPLVHENDFVVPPEGGLVRTVKTSILIENSLHDALNQMALRARETSLAAELRGNLDEAAKWCCALMALGNQGRRDCTGQTFWFWARFTELGAEELERLIARPDAPDALLWQAIAYCQAAEPAAEEWRTAVLRSLQLAEHNLAAVKTEADWKVVCDHTLFVNEKNKPTLEAATAAMKKFHETAVALLSKPLRETASVQRDTDPRFMGMFAHWKCDAVLSTVARTKLMLCAIQTRAAIILYQRRNKKLPESLYDLVPEYLWSVPQDVYVEQPLHYAETDYGWKVWSIGADRVDNGGNWRLHGPDNWSGDDIVFYSLIETNEQSASRLLYLPDKDGKLVLKKK